MAVGGRLQWYQAALDELLLSVDGPLGMYLGHLAEIVTQGAKRRCPVSPDGSHGRPSGYTRSQIGWEIGTDSYGPYAYVMSPAMSPTGYPIGYGLEIGTAPHVIKSHGLYPLKDKYGRVFGQKVNHPGTLPQPYLRPALDDIRGM